MGINDGAVAVISDVTLSGFKGEQCGIEPVGCPFTRWCEIEAISATDDETNGGNVRDYAHLYVLLARLLIEKQRHYDG